MGKKYIKTLEAFMEAWKDEKWEEAVKTTQLTWQHSKVHADFIKQALGNEKIAGFGNPAEALKNLLVPSVPKLLKYEIKGHKSISKVTKDVKVNIEYESANKAIQHKTLVARLICEEAPMIPSPKGKWGVNPISLFTKRR